MYSSLFATRIYNKAIEIAGNALLMDVTEIGVVVDGKVISGYDRCWDDTNEKPAQGFEIFRLVYIMQEFGEHHVSPIHFVFKEERIKDFTTMEKTFINSIIYCLEIFIRRLNSDNNQFIEEIIESFPRHCIPKYLNDLLSADIRKVPKVLSDTGNLDYGKIIREVTRWRNSKIEGREIHTGFILVDSIQQFENQTEIRVIRLNSSYAINLFEFSRVRSLLEIADGKKSVLIAVPKNRGNIEVQGIAIFPQELEPGLTTNQIGFRAPVFIVQPSGIKIGRGNQLILEYTNGQPRIRTSLHESFVNKLHEQFNMISSSQITKKRTQETVRVLMELSTYGKGASFVFGFDENVHRDSVDMTTSIKERLPLNWGDYKNPGNDAQMILLSQISKTDGAVLVNKRLEIVGFGAILRAPSVQANITGGSRHKSMASYTCGKKLFGIVISSDGPISLISNNKVLARL